MDNTEQFFRDEVWSYYHFLKKLFYTLTLDGPLTDDLVQETMFRCWRKIETVKRYKNMKPALATIARNEFRKYRRGYKDAFVELMEPEKLHWIQCNSNIEEYIREEGDIHEFLLLFKGIKKEYVQVVLLADYYELSLKDIAKLTKRKYNTVASYHARGLEEMRMHEDLLERLACKPNVGCISLEKFLGFSNI